MGAQNVLTDLFRPLHQAAARIQRGFLARLRVQLVQFGNGVPQIVFFRLHRRNRGFGLGQTSPRLPRRRPGGAQRSQVQSGKAVQQLPMPARVQKAPVILLAMQFHQRIGQGTQHLARGAAVIDEGGLAAIGHIDPAQDQLVFRLDPRLVQHGPRRMTGRKIEDGGHFALRRACADQLGTAPPAQHEAQRIEQNRLARPGLASQHVQARLEPKVQPVDDQHVADVKPAEHSLRPAALEPLAADNLAID
jgi:hypothetical protein